MKIACMSDLHGKLDPRTPDADLLLLAGDLLPDGPVGAQADWMARKLLPWVNRIAQRMPVIAVAGNHDWIFQLAPDRVPPMPWTYLQDSGAVVKGLKIWGSPWQPMFYNWAFNLDETELRKKWAMIPDDTDILLLHGPPHGCGDFAVFSQEHVGSPSLRDRILAIQPKLAVAGHIHSGYGRYILGSTIVVNASQVDEKYRLVNDPIVVEIKAKPSTVTHIPIPDEFARLKSIRFIPADGSPVTEIDLRGMEI